MKRFLVIRIVCLAIVSLLLPCCTTHSQFSKYETEDSNDITNLKLQGQINKVEIYSNGHLDRILSFNKWGLYEEYITFTDDSISKVQRYVYDQYGKLKKVVFTFKRDKDSVITYLYNYNDNKDVVSVISESSSINHFHIDRHLVKTCEYKYNKLGQIYKVITNTEHSVDGLMFYDLFDENGRKIESGNQNIFGKVTNKTKYIYNLEGQLSRTDNYTYNGDVIIHHYTTYYYEIPNKSYLLTKEANDDGKSSMLWTYEYDSNDNVVLKKLWEDNVLTTETYFRYKYDNNNNWIEKIDSTLILNSNSHEKSIYVDTIKRVITYY